MPLIQSDGVLCRVGNQNQLQLNVPQKTEMRLISFPLPETCHILEIVAIHLMLFRVAFGLQVPKQLTMVS